MFPAALGDLFKGLRDAKSRDERERKAKEAKEILCAIVDELAGTDQATPHGSKITVPLPGHETPVPLAYAAIEHARRLVETHQELPSKAEVRHALIKSYPEELAVLAPSTWPKVWREAGLKDLPVSKTW